MTPLGERTILAAYTNITADKRREFELAASERINREILAGLQEGVVVVDTQRVVAAANEAAARLFGIALDEFLGRAMSGIPVDLLDDRGRLLPTERLPLVRALRGEAVRAFVVRLVRRDGSLLWVEANANPLLGEDGELYGAVASYDDVTTRVEQDRRTRHEADTDPLTGLANRRALERTLDAALTRAGARRRSLGLLMLDLDGFKAVNDQYGHAAGDAVLREVARRLRRTVRERDVVARLGGDEFVVVLTDLGGRSGAAEDAVERVEARAGRADRGRRRGARAGGRARRGDLPRRRRRRRRPARARRPRDVRGEGRQRLAAIVGLSERRLLQPARRRALRGHRADHRAVGPAPPARGAALGAAGRPARGSGPP